MRHSFMCRPVRLSLLAGSSAVLLSACAEQPLDFDLRGNLGSFTTAQAATEPMSEATIAVTRPSNPYSSSRVLMTRRLVAPNTLRTAESYTRRR